MRKEMAKNCNQGWLSTPFSHLSALLYPQCIVASPKEEEKSDEEEEKKEKTVPFSSIVSTYFSISSRLQKLSLFIDRFYKIAVQQLTIYHVYTRLSLDSSKDTCAASRIPIKKERRREFFKDSKNEIEGITNPSFFVPRSRIFASFRRIIHRRVRQRPRLAAGNNLATRLIGFRPIRKVHDESPRRTTHSPSPPPPPTQR